MVDSDVNDLRLAISRLATDHARHLEALLASATTLEARLARLAALERVAAAARRALGLVEGERYPAWRAGMAYDRGTTTGRALHELRAALHDLDGGEGVQHDGG